MEPIFNMNEPIYEVAPGPEPVPHNEEPSHPEGHPNAFTFLLQLHMLRDISVSDDVKQISDKELHYISKQEPWTLTTNNYAVLKLYTEWYISIHNISEAMVNANYPSVKVITDLPDDMPCWWWVKVPLRRSLRQRKPVMRYLN